MLSISFPTGSVTMEAVEKEFVALKRARIFFVFFFFFGNGFKREPVYIYTLTHYITPYII